MLSFYRSGLLALTLVSGTIGAVHAQQTTHLTWISDVSFERMQDKSLLTEYFGEGVSKEHRDIIFRVGFIPRFGCAPLITFEFGEKALHVKEAGANVVGIPNDLSSLAVAIDDTALSFPTVIDYDKGRASVYMNANLQRRITARVRVEVGERMKVSFDSGNSLNFSLLGSRDAISIAYQRCRRHDPSIQG